jgi:hypothetical protein
VNLSGLRHCLESSWYLDRYGVQLCPPSSNLMDTYVDYTPKIRKEELEHGAYYIGRCRNASIARWNALDGLFRYHRYKFGKTFVDEIYCPEDEVIYDAFVTERLADPDEIGKEIPLFDK